MTSLALLAAASLVAAPTDTGLQPPFYELPARPKAAPRTAYYWLGNPIPTTKLSPKVFGPTKEPYTFDWIVAGYVRPQDKPENLALRFRVYNQLKPKSGDETFGATRLLLRLWETLDTWNADHSYDYAGGVVDLYLCWGGTPGGEALFDHDPQVPKGVNGKVATMYIYDLPSFKNPVERAREIAHEYGHLVLPAVGGYSEPEDWANGVLGERLFLTELAKDLKSGAVPESDAFGVTPTALDLWLSKNVFPHRDRAAVEGPFAPRFARKDKVGMDAFIGELSLLQAMLAPKRFGRALRLMETQEPKALIKSAPLAMEEGGADLSIPAALGNKPIWIPVGKTKVSGAKVLVRRSGRAKVQPSGPKISLRL